MKKLHLLFALILGALVAFPGCKSEDDDPEVTPDPGSSSTELLVKKFTAAPTLDGVKDDMWGGAQRLEGTVEVPDLAVRGTYLNGDGAGTEENLGLFDPYTGETQDFIFRSGYFGDRIYFLLEWDDMEDSKDRESWYFDNTDKLWKQQHKYANDANDKFYEDKFAILFPIGTVSGFSTTTCYATCHQNLDIVKDKDKHTRHFTKNANEKVDMWHWKRVRGAYAGQIDDQVMGYDDIAKESAANGRRGDASGSAGYANNKQTLNNGNADVSVPMYVIPGQTNYYWITEDDVTNGTAKLITAVDANGVLTYAGGTIDPAAGGFEANTGNKRLPSVVISSFTGGRADIDIEATHTSTGWVAEFSRKLNTGDPDDVVFNIAEELDFGMAIFNNAAIAHAIKPNLKLKFEQ